MDVERPDQEFASRVTIDLDGDKYDHGQFDLRAVRIWHNLQESADYVDVHVSSSGLGLHFVAWFREDMQFAEEVAVRRANGDDPRRIWMDCQRWMQGLYTDVLFTEKDGREMSKERRFADVYAALSFVAQNRTTDADRVQRLAEHGHRAEPSLARRADL